MLTEGGRLENGREEAAASVGWVTGDASFSAAEYEEIIGIGAFESWWWGHFAIEEGSAGEDDPLCGDDHWVGVAILGSVVQ
ncbi:hypothetical protein L2E82_11786 [Cichorium intybus]|uniref:Uncharacterized protein n=2 Tax=Cichorium intybus TaxID=13427 RepID=A0ACB9GE60_CICIN|nr:hypothetical protein L2E82_11785 [Cichorium intybus]KAI3781762.1 hypothetical protein L2E82_11786 [Cichorium intybus]